MKQRRVRLALKAIKAIQDIY